MPISGVVELRQWSFSAAQSAHGTAATPTGGVPWTGSPNLDPHWTSVADADVGIIDENFSPYRLGQDIAATLTGDLDYDRIPLLMGPGVRGGQAAVGSPARTWTHQALSTALTSLDELSAAWGDDFGQDDFRFRDGIIEQLEFTLDDNLGPWKVSSQWYFGYGDPHVVKPTGITVPSNLPLVFGADTELRIDGTPGGIGTTLISDALHGARITIRNTIDKKRFANGSNSRFSVAGYALTAREIEAEFSFAKTTAIAGFATTSELRQWLNADPINRYLRLLVQSTKSIPGTATPYSWDVRLPLTWRTVGQAERAGNTALTFMGRGFYDATLTYPFRSQAVNNKAALP